MTVGKLLPSAATFVCASLIAVAGCAPTPTGGAGSSGGAGGGAGAAGGSGSGAAGTVGAGGGAGNSVTGSGGSAGAGGAAGSSAGGSAGSGAAGTGTGTGGRGGAVGAAGRGGGSGAGGSGGMTGAAGTTGTGGSASGSAPTLSGLMVEANPNSTISCYVSWTTNVAASSEVQFGAGSYQFSITDAAAVTQHRVLVIGMKAQTRYLIKAVSATAGGSGSAESSFMTGALPAQIVAAQVPIAEAGAYQPGWTLTNLMSGSGGFSSMYPAAAVMFDEQGVVVWYFINGTGRDSRGDVSVDLLADNHVLIGPIGSEPPKEIDLGGNITWKGPAQVATGGNIATHHAGKLTNGNYVIIREDHTNSYGVTGARFDEVSASNQVVYNWNLTDYVRPPSGAQTDWCHANSLVVDLPNDVFYFACRYLGVYKVRRSDKSIIWFLGAGGDFAFSPANSVFKDEHDPELHADGTMLIYDNGGLAMGSTSGYHSRVVEYKLDEAMKKATLVWEFPGTFAVDAWYKNDWYTPYWGDADRLANGNVLINAGIRDTSKGSRIFEVRPTDGKVVWQLVLPGNTGTYRAERVTPPLVKKL